MALMVLSKARVKPNLDGEFCVSILNVNPNRVKLFKRTRIGRVTAAEKILEVKPRDEIPSNKPHLSILRKFIMARIFIVMKNRKLMDL